LVHTLILGFVALACMYSVVNPLFEAPDEVWHYEYSRWLVEGHGLPRPEDVGHAPWAQEGSQPPLYYLLAAGLTGWITTDNAAAVIRYNPHAAIGQAAAFGNKNMMIHGPTEAWPWRGVVLAAQLIRGFSIVLGALTVYFAYHSARLLFGGGSAVPLLTASLIAFNPQFLFLSASVNNDNLVTTACVIGVWWMIRLLRRPITHPIAWHEAIGLGAVVGVAALSKVSGLALALPVALTITWLAWQRRSLRLFLQLAIIAATASALIAGWWYWRNWQLYGEPLGLSAMFAVLPGRGTPLTLAEAWALAQGVWRSFWAVFGWFNVVGPTWLYAVYSTLALLGLLGLLIGPLFRRRTAWWQATITAPGFGAAIVLLTVWLVVVLALVVRWTQISYPQGRLLFPAISALMILLAWGLTNWLPRRWHKVWATVLSSGLALIAIVAPWFWLLPVYTPPPLLASTATVPNATNIVFADQLALRGYDWSPAAARPGEKLTVELYWQALQPLPEDYSVFIHLTDDNDILQAQRDSYPAAGLWPTQDWPQNGIVVDRHELILPTVLPAPTALRIDIGLYDFRTGQRLQTNGQDFWTLGRVEVPQGRADDVQVSVNFGDQIILTDYSFDRWRLHAGEEFAVNLQWQALRQPDADYVVFLHLLLPPDAVWAQRDEMPQDGQAPTSAWVAGQQVTDRMRLTVPAEAPPGLYAVEIGLYDRETGERLTVDLSDAGVLLGRVRVVAQE